MRMKFTLSFVEFVLTDAKNNKSSLMFKQRMTTEEVEKLETEEAVKKFSESERKKLELSPWLFTRRDQLALLQAFLDFASVRGDPFKNMDRFCDYVKGFVYFDTSKSQVVKNRVRRLKKMFKKNLKMCLIKGKGEDEPIFFPTSFDKEAFEVSKKIWGKNGFLASKVSKKLERKVKEINSAHEVSVASTPLTSGRQIASLFKAANVLSGCVDEATVIERWGRLEDGPKKRGLDAKYKKIQNDEMECLVMRTGFLVELVEAMSKTMNPHN
ncbi:GLABROUS1 enhancer-binding protein-like [Cardamine amara subsp. amara]|uniref:GLABROUS1 enhancer-binding protein-like n=1 Tax=Cardamine amara subsp. amara TaxID=228776 RepID=A0ABD1BPW1_CARAN